MGDVNRVCGGGESATAKIDSSILRGNSARWGCVMHNQKW